MKLINLVYATALLECIKNVPANITVTEISNTQRAFGIYEPGDNFVTAVIGIKDCLNRYNVTGSNSYVDVLNTHDPEYIDWVNAGTEVSLAYISRLMVRDDWVRQKRENDDEDLKLHKRYLGCGNINLRGYQSRGCNNSMLWNLDNCGVNGNCIGAVPTPVSKSLGYDYHWNIDQLWAQTGLHSVS